MDINQAIETAKSEIQKQFNVAYISIKSSGLKNGTWRINTSFILNNEQKYYSVNVNNDNGSVEDIYETKFNSGDIGSAPTLITIAFVFSILAIIFYAIMLIIYGVTGIFAVSPPPSIIMPLVVFIFIILLISSFIDIYTLTKIIKIRKFICDGDYKSAYIENNVDFGILALIFGGIITGILLLVAHNRLKAGN